MPNKKRLQRYRQLKLQKKIEKEVWNITPVPCISFENLREEGLKSYAALMLLAEKYYPEYKSKLPNIQFS